jgi:hypothetical protein
MRRRDFIKVISGAAAALHSRRGRSSRENRTGLVFSLSFLERTALS